MDFHLFFRASVHAYSLFNLFDFVLALNSFLSYYFHLVLAFHLVFFHLFLFIALKFIEVRLFLFKFLILCACCLFEYSYWKLFVI